MNLLLSISIEGSLIVRNKYVAEFGSYKICYVFLLILLLLPDSLIFI
jgi:hypothetical protein